MNRSEGTPASSAPDHRRCDPAPPRPAASLVLGVVSLIVIAASAWLALQPAAETAQTATMLWFNDPPQPFAAVFAATNPLLRPVPLLVVAVLLAGWVLLAAAGPAQRLEQLRALLVSLALAEVTAQVMKRLADQPRPPSVIPGLDMHGYPSDPLGNAYPSAHTAMVVAGVCGLWFWMTWPQRLTGASFAVLVACNRLYVGAHWPIDVVGGAAIGLLAGSTAWLVARRWPMRR